MRLPSSGHRWIGDRNAVSVVLVLMFALIYLAAGAGWKGSSLATAVGTTMMCGVPMVAGILTFRSASRLVGRARTSWRLLGGGAVSWSLGNSAYAFYEVVLRTEVPFPGPPDLGFLGATALISAGALCYPSAVTRGFSRLRAGLDAAMVTGAVLLLGWLAVIERVYRDGGLSSVQAAVGLAYPVGDVLVVSVLLMALRRRALGGTRALTLLAVGMSLLVTADMGFLLTTSAGTYYTGHPVDVGWWAGMFLFWPAVRAYRYSTAPGGFSALTSWAVALPYAVTAVSFAAVAAHWLRERKLSWVEISLCAALVTLTLVRQLVVTLDSVRLAAEVRRHEEDLRFHAYHDALTLLPNRRALRERLESSLEPGGEVAAVLFIDLDGFKTVNDTLGHEVGDGLLREAARRLREVAGPNDLVARLGGDEFAVALAPGPEPADVARTIVLKLREAFTPEDGDGAVPVTASVGVAPWERGETAAEILRNADLAMYRAKAAGRDQIGIYEPHLHGAARRRLETEVALRRALDDSEFELAYQPVVELATSTTIAVEALLRWRRGGVLVTPDQFITVAEESGLIVPIGAWVVDRACADLAGWDERGLSELTVAVNVATAQLREPGFADMVLSVLARRGLSPDRLTVEITERVLLDDSPKVVAGIKALHDTGVELALDDFGTGFASLASLRVLPVSTLKIDRTFVAELERDEPALVTGFAALARHLGMTTVAEGIETPRQFEILKAAGVDLGQGYLFAAPMPGEGIPVFIQRKDGALLGEGR